jgi:hypothetical protein
MKIHSKLKLVSFFLIKKVNPLNDAKFDNIFFPTELHLKNVYYLYSVCSNLTNVVTVIVLSMIIRKGA